MPPKAKGGGNVISDIFGDTGRKTPPPARATPPPPPAKGKAAAHKAAPASAPPANPPRGRFGPSAAEQKREMEAAGRRRRGDRDGSGSPGPQPREGKDPRPDPREGREARDPRDRDAKDAKDARPGQSGQPEQPKEPRQRGRAADRAEPPAAPERSPSAASSGLSEHELSDASEGRRGRARDSVRSSSPVLKLPNDEASDAGDPPPKNAREDARKRRRTEPPEPLRQLHHPPADSKSPVPGAMHPDTLYAVRGLLTVLSGRKQSTKTPLFIPFDPNFVSAPPRSFPTSVPSLQAIENRVEKGGYPDMATFLEEVAASLGGYLKYLARRLGLLTGHSFADAEAGLSGVELPLAASEGYEQDPVERKKVVNKLMAWGKAVEGADKDLAKHIERNIVPEPASAAHPPPATSSRPPPARSSTPSESAHPIGWSYIPESVSASNVRAMNDFLDGHARRRALWAGVLEQLRKGGGEGEHAGEETEAEGEKGEEEERPRRGKRGEEGEEKGEEKGRRRRRLIDPAAEEGDEAPKDKDKEKEKDKDRKGKGKAAEAEPEPVPAQAQEPEEDEEEQPLMARVTRSKRAQQEHAAAGSPPPDARPRKEEAAEGEGGEKAGKEEEAPAEEPPAAEEEQDAEPEARRGRGRRSHPPTVQLPAPISVTVDAVTLPGALPSPGDAAPGSKRRPGRPRKSASAPDLNALNSPEEESAGGDTPASVALDEFPAAAAGQQEEDEGRRASRSGKRARLQAEAAPAANRRTRSKASAAHEDEEEGEAEEDEGPRRSKRARTAQSEDQPAAEEEGKEGGAEEQLAEEEQAAEPEPAPEAAVEEQQAGPGTPAVEEPPAQEDAAAAAEQEAATETAEDRTDAREASVDSMQVEHPAAPSEQEAGEPTPEPEPRSAGGLPLVDYSSDDDHFVEAVEEHEKSPATQGAPLTSMEVEPPTGPATVESPGAMVEQAGEEEGGDVAMEEAEGTQETGEQAPVAEEQQAAGQQGMGKTVPSAAAPGEIAPAPETPAARPAPPKPERKPSLIVKLPIPEGATTDGAGTPPPAEPPATPHKSVPAIGAASLPNSPSMRLQDRGQALASALRNKAHLQPGVLILLGHFVPGLSHVVETSGEITVDLEAVSDADFRKVLDYLATGVPPLPLPGFVPRGPGGHFAPAPHAQAGQPAAPRERKRNDKKRKR